MDPDPDYGNHHVCKKCNQQCPSQAALKRHTKSIHSDTAEPNEGGRPKKYDFVKDTDPKDGREKFKCQNCGLFFKDISGMRVHHLAIHLKDEEFQKCWICPLTFPVSKIWYHMKHLHSQNGVYKCHV